MQMHEAVSHLLRAIDRLDSLDASLGSGSGSQGSLAGLIGAWEELASAARAEADWLGSQPSRIADNPVIAEATNYLGDIALSAQAVIGDISILDVNGMLPDMEKVAAAIRGLDGLRSDIGQLASPSPQQTTLQSAANYIVSAPWPRLCWSPTIPQTCGQSSGCVEGLSDDKAGR